MFEKSVAHFFLNLFKNSIEQRRKDNIVKKDFLNLLIQLLDHGEVEEDDGSRVTDKKIEGISFKLISVIS